MTNKLRNVRLYGRLGARFGRVHRLAVASTAEAIRALGVLLPGFQAELMNAHQRGVRYACFVGRENINKDQLHYPVGGDDIRIAPVLAGAKRGGLFQTILGAVIVVVAGFFTGGGAFAALGAGGFAGAAASFGAAMFFGGIVQMLSPQKQSLSTRDSPNNGASYNFNGPVNTTAQGNPVPVLYGRMIIGSAVVSAGIYSEDQL